MNRIVFAVVPALVFSACGMGVSSPDVEAYGKTVFELQAAVTAHQRDAAATTTPQDCAAEHQRYDDLMRLRLLQLTQNKLTEQLPVVTPCFGTSSPKPSGGTRAARSAGSRWSMETRRS